MSLVPEFELGLLNAWILVLLIFLIGIGLSSLVIRLFFGNERYKESSERHSRTPEYTRIEKIASDLSTVMLIAMVAYSVFLPLKLCTAWFYLGLLIYVFGMVFGFIGTIHFALAPSDKPATEGVYRISRNPMYLGMFLMFFGIGVACASWLFLLLSVISMILSARLVSAEERLCLETFGDSYREYMSRTSRWIGIPKSETKERV